MLTRRVRSVLVQQSAHRSHLDQPLHTPGRRDLGGAADARRSRPCGRDPVRSAQAVSQAVDARRSHQGLCGSAVLTGRVRVRADDRMHVGRFQYEDHAVPVWRQPRLRAVWLRCVGRAESGGASPAGRLDPSGCNLRRFAGRGQNHSRSARATTDRTFRDITNAGHRSVV